MCMSAHRRVCSFFFSWHQVEKRLELVKQVSHSTHKKLTACLQGQQGVDVDKKSVRSPSVSSRRADGEMLTALGCREAVGGDVMAGKVKVKHKKV